ncbi:lysophospholipid acyltransferase family protein [Roseomonas sp. CCTCC AB2023176]|uniref:lysophospholipid acyltransferase family protein n=1 Tax=Roseomonas sp. CCTCC AB2023176 TaxID=3342640 RepID=UPI0035DC45E0
MGLPLLLARPETLLTYIRGWSRLTLWLLRVICGVRWRMTGLENLPPSGPALLAAQHQSAFDTVIWNAVLPRTVYVMKVELLRIPIWSAMAKHVGSIFVDRAAGGAALRDLVRAAKAAAAAGRQIVIFPEGTRTEFGERRPWQPGVAAIVSATGLPLIPVATDSGRFWGRRAFRKRPGTITVAILPPLSPDLPRAELLHRAQAAVAEAIPAPVDKAVERAAEPAPRAPEESRPSL